LNVKDCRAELETKNKTRSCKLKKVDLVLRIARHIVTDFNQGDPFYQGKKKHPTPWTHPTPPNPLRPRPSHLTNGKGSVTGCLWQAGAVRIENENA